MNSLGARSVPLLLLVTYSVCGQGTVFFANDSTTLSFPPDRLIRYSTCGDDPPAVGTNWLVQLYYGASTASENQLVAVSSAPARLRASTTTIPGVWSGGGFRTLDGFPFGFGYVKLQVRIWDVSCGGTWEQSFGNPACNNGNGKSF